MRRESSISCVSLRRIYHAKLLRYRSFDFGAVPTAIRPPASVALRYRRKKKRDWVSHNNSRQLKACHRAPALKVRHSESGAIPTTKKDEKCYTRYRLLKPRGLAGPQPKILSTGTRPSRGGQEGLDLSRPLSIRDAIFNIRMPHIIEPSPSPIA